MKNVYTIVAIVVALYSCKTNQKTVVEGDLYFKLVDLPSLYEAPDSLATKFETNIRTVQKDSLSTNDRYLYNQLQFLDDNHLLRKPFIRIRKNDGTILLVFVEPTDYEKLRKYHHQELVRNQKKVSITAEVSEIKNNALTVYTTSKAITIKEMDGTTYWTK